MSASLNRAFVTATAGFFWSWVLTGAADWCMVLIPRPMPQPPATFLYANSEICADLLYCSGFTAPDAFAFLKKRGGNFMLLSDLEIDRGKKQARDVRVESLSAVKSALQKHLRSSSPQEIEDVLAFWLKSHRVKSVRVPSDFPLGLARRLCEHGIEVTAQTGAIWPERETKSPEEIAALRRAMGLSVAGMARAVEVLRASEIGRRDKLMWGGRVLTAEALRLEIDSAVLRAGGLARGTIVACGEQACDPHETGSGPLRANQLLILDIFPRDTRTGYHGDMTRTLVRGRASEAMRHLWQTCLDGQKFALRSVRPGVAGATIHAELQRRFAAAGFPKTDAGGRWSGFFHGTGHGLGLEVHEAPRFDSTVFRPGQVLTVEPGIYQPGIGGVRHEDVVVVTPTGNRLLGTFPKFLEV